MGQWWVTPDFISSWPATTQYPSLHQKKIKSIWELATEAMASQTCVYAQFGVNSPWRISKGRTIHAERHLEWLPPSGWLMLALMPSLLFFLSPAFLSPPLPPPQISLQDSTQLNYFPSVGGKGGNENDRGTATKEMWQSFGVKDLILVWNSQLLHKTRPTLR